MYIALRLTIGAYASLMRPYNSNAFEKFKRENTQKTKATITAATAAAATAQDPYLRSDELSGKRNCQY